MNELKGRKEVSICLAILFFALAFILKFPNDYFNKILYAISYLLVGVEVVIKALKNIKNHSFLDENFLMTISTIGAFLINRWAEALAVMLFYQIGELFQDYAVTKSRKSIASLMNIRPDYANLITASETIKVDPVKVKVGDVIVVKPGEKIPLDGIVIEGNSSLDTKALTGESMPVDVTKNDQVLSGTINLNGVIKIKVTSEFSNSTVNQILNLVENVSSKKAKTENFITKFAYYYTPIVIIVAIFMIIFMPLLTPVSFKTWLYRGLEFLVVSCPCALVVSIPLSFFGGIGKASQCGILIKGGNYLEALTNLKTVIFDKTGTLTKGVFKVQEIKTKSIKADELLKYASYAEIYSSHPLASAIKEKYEKELDSSKITSIKELSGLGIKAKIDGHLVLVGNDKLMQKYKIKGYKNLDETVLNIAIDGEYKGYILVADEIKPEAKVTLQKLKENGIKKIFLFTGDKNADTRQFKEMLIDEVNTNMLPQDKIAKMEDILAHKDVKEVVAFVGDGINDAPVLALADIGIAMGLIGADSALEAADIIIMNDELDKINEAILIAKKTMRIVKENIVLAIGVKLIVLLLASLGVASMWEAVFADVGVTLIAVINALRILKTQTI